MGPTAAYTEPGTLQTGAPIPDWTVRDDTGRIDNLRGICEGNRSIVLFTPRPASPGTRQAIKALAKLGGDLPGPFARIAVLPADTEGTDAVKLAIEGVRLLVLVNQELPFDRKQIAWAATDKAANIMNSGLTRPAEVGRLATQLHTAPQGNRQPDSPRSATAPVLMVPEVLDKNLCRRLIEHFENSAHTPSGVLDLSGTSPRWHPDPAVKQRRDLQLDDPRLIDALERAIASRVLPQIRKAFNYAVTHHEPFKLVRYDTGSGYFRPHRDNETRDTDYRRFAMTINLNTDEYDGGALEFPEFGDALYRPPLGGGIVFSCSLLHEATDVTRGSRYAVLCFFYNPADGL